MTTGDVRRWMWSEACATIERAERSQRHFFQPASDDALKTGWEPPIDIFETEREILVTVALPGIQPQDLEVSVHAGGVTIAGSRRLSALGREAFIHRLEIPRGRFAREIRLSEPGLQIAQSVFNCGCLFLNLTKNR